MTMHHRHLHAHPLLPLIGRASLVVTASADVSWRSGRSRVFLRKRSLQLREPRGDAPHLPRTETRTHPQLSESELYEVTSESLVTVIRGSAVRRSGLGKHARSGDRVEGSGTAGWGALRQ